MDINLPKEEITVTSGFVNFRIRDYVAEIRKKDKKKCWPFGSLGDPEIYDQYFSSYDQSPESTFLSSKMYPMDTGDSEDNKPDTKEAPNSIIKVEMLNGNENRSESASNKVNNAECQHKNSIDESAKNGNADYYEPGRIRPQKNHQKFRFLSDISSGPFKPHDRNNNNSRFATKTEDDLDDNVPLDVIFRKRKGAEDLPSKKRTVLDEEPSHVQDKSSKNGSKDSNVNGNSRFTLQTEDDLDDNTPLDAVFRKRKGIEVTLQSKKKKTIQVEEPRPVQDKISKDSHGNDSVIHPRIHSINTIIDDFDTQTTLKGKNRAQNDVGMQKDLSCEKSNLNAEVGSMEANETVKNDSEMEAVMLLACHFNEEKRSANDRIPIQLETKTDCACVQKKLRELLNEQNRSAFVCPMNRNPADFSLPNAENKFMRGG